MIGYSIVISIIFLLVIIGHRTSLISFLVVFISFFFQRSTIRILYNYYKYFLNFIVGISAFLGFYFFYYFFGLKDAMRGRVAMWEAHAQFFFDSSAFEILFGKQFILLDPKYAHENLIGPLALFEAHNNTFRTIIFFGVLGFLAYCIFMRWVVLKVHSIAQDGRILFLMFSCFTFLVLYSITNEPFYYGSVLWPILIWIFLAQSIKQDERHES